jgi:DNA polymerase I-like protein with 3'-5' exonuclease and polymerase domains
MDLFSLIEEEGGVRTVANDEWRPEEPPDLDGVDDVVFNFETTGLRWFESDLPIALAIYAKNRSWYLPFGHPGGGNLSEGRVYAFAQSLKGKHLNNINSRFDIHMGRVWGEKMGNGGLDFEAMGCTFSDVGHDAALIDDQRYLMNLDALIEDYLHEEPMVRLDESRMASYSAGAAQARARYNVEAVYRLTEVFRPMLEEQNLLKVKKLENEVIPVVVEMEKHGTLIDLELLAKWIIETRDKYHKSVMDLYKVSGLKINPNSPKDQKRLFDHYKIPMTELTDGGAPSFTDEVLKHVDHPSIKQLRYSKKLKSLNSKLRKYQESVDSNGILRYALHQLRASKDEAEEGKGTGTVVGRFTSTEIVDGVGINIQQVLKPEKQILTYGDEFFVRDLHIAPKGLQFLSVDAEQIQYRIFAHEANNAKVLAAYRENPYLSFHKYMWPLLKAYKEDITYKRTKDVNFAKIFIAGLAKLSLMMEFISKKEFLELRAMHAGKDHPKLAKALEILKIYSREIPEADTLSRDATNLANTRGYVKSILGRRMRFLKDRDGKAMRGHKALNGRIIMSEADIVKTKAVELHKNRKYTGLTLCFQVHDEFDGYVQEEENRRRVQEVLNIQSFPSLRVPILWKAKMASSWGATAKEELEQIRKDMHL